MRTNQWLYMQFMIHTKHGGWVLGWAKCGTSGELVDDLVEYPVSTTSVLEYEENDKDGVNLNEHGTEDA